MSREILGDAFGQALLAYYNGKEDACITTERMDKFSTHTYVRNYFSLPEKSKRDDVRIMESMPKGSRALDIGCGAGRHLLFMQGLGINVTGIDISEGAVEVCKLQGATDVRLVSLEETSRALKSEFDFITMFGHNFGLFGSEFQAKEILNSFAAITTKDAKIYASSRDRRPVSKRDIEYCELNVTIGRLPNQLYWRDRYQNIISKWYDYLFVSIDELNNILKDTCWKLTASCHTYDVGGSTYIATLEKK